MLLNNDLGIADVADCIVVSMRPDLGDEGMQQLMQALSQRLMLGRQHAVTLFEAGDYLWALKQGKSWYLAGTEKCEFQRWKDAPAEPPGKLVGTFTRKNDKLEFVPAEKAPVPIRPAGE